MTQADKAAAWDQLTELVAASRRMLAGIPLDGSDNRDGHSDGRRLDSQSGQFRTAITPENV